jgi:hypothetical protein
MKSARLGWRCLSVLLSLCQGILLGIATLVVDSPVLAQSITPAADGTGTIVTPDGNRIDISGGSLSGDGDGEVLPVQPGDLAELLTGSGEEVETGVEVNQEGNVQLADTGVTLPKETGIAIVSGEIDVSNVGAVGAQSLAPSSSSSSTGGEINVIGNKVGLISANLDASGNNGGGTVRIGGGEKGLEPIPNADVTFISEDSSINADALDWGNGGRTIVWSNQTTRTYGHISARGGAYGGNGGFVETSSAGFLDVPVAPDITAPAGDGGTWLIDLTISLLVRRLIAIVAPRLVSALRRMTPYSILIPS